MNAAVTAANTSATNAATSATNAATSASSALAIYGNTTAMNAAVTAASTSATHSANSETASANSATSATTSATNANISAGAAGLSATNAANSAASALSIYGSTAAVNAAVVSAQGSATAAAGSASSALAIYGSTAAMNTAVNTTTTNANSAQASATAAAGSATQAAASAASAAAIVTGVASNRPSIRPSLLLDFADTRLLDPRITFARASTATFYDQTTTALAEQNLLLQSQAFNNGYWGSVATTVSDNTTVAPDGTTTASTITLGVSGANALFNATGISVTALSTYTFSFYALRGTATDMSYAIYNLTGASFITAVSYYSQTNSSTWSRIVVTFTVPAGCTSARVYTSSNSTSTGTFYLWGAQLEQRSAVTAYTPTTTQAITNYIPVMQTAASGVARFDCNPSTGESLGLLIEESRTNLLVNSATFVAVTNIAVTTSANVSPDGTLNASYAIPNATSGYHNTSTSSTVVTATAYTMSVFAKAGAYTRLGVREGVGSGTAALFDLTAGTVISGTGTITPVGNSWYRCVVPFTSSGTSAALTCFPYPSSTTNPLTIFSGDGFSGVYLWGQQLEAGAFATSYIPTVASQVTRAADAASMTGTNFSSWYNVGQGSFYGEANLYGGVNGLYNYIAYATDGTTTNNIKLGFYNNGTSNYGGLGISVTSVAQTIFVTAGLSANTFAKLAGSYAPNNFAISKDGATAVTSSSGGIPAVSSLYIGQRVGNAEYIDGHIKRITYYPKALTSTELQGLTS